MGNRDKINNPKMGHKQRFDDEYGSKDSKRYKGKPNRKSDKRKFLDEDEPQNGRN